MKPHIVKMRGIWYVFAGKRSIWVLGWGVTVLQAYRRSRNKDRFSINGTDKYKEIRNV